MTIQTLTRFLQIPTTGLFRFRTERYEVQHLQVTHKHFELCMTLERHTQTSEVTVWLESSDLDFVKPALWNKRQQVIKELVQCVRHASLTHHRQGTFKGTQTAQAFSQMCQDITQMLAH